MSHQAVRDLIRDTALSLDDRIQFEYGQESDINALRNKDYPLFYLNPLRRQVRPDLNFTSVYPVNIIIYKLDNPEGAEEETQKILDETDEMVTRFIAKLNLHDVLSETADGAEDRTDIITTQRIELGTVDVIPLIKQTADVVTGWGLTFSMTVPDDFDYCTIYP